VDAKPQMKHADLSVEKLKVYVSRCSGCFISVPSLVVEYKAFKSTIAIGIAVLRLLFVLSKASNR